MRSPLRRLRQATAVLLCSALGVFAAPAAAGAAETARSSVSADILEAKIKEVEATAEIDPDSRDKLIELYRKSLSDLQKASSSDADAESFRTSMQTAANQAALRREQTETLVEDAIDPAVSKTTHLSDIEQLLFQEQANLAAVETAQKTVADLLAKAVEIGDAAIQLRDFRVDADAGIPGVFQRGATKPEGMPRRFGVPELLPRGLLEQGRRAVNERPPARAWACPAPSGPSPPARAAHLRRGMGDALD